MSLSITAVTIDCVDARRVAGFWSAVLDRPVDDGANPFFASIGMHDHGSAQPAVFFIQVPEGKQGKNRVHLDLHTPDLQAQIERVVGLGATRVRDVAEHGFTWTTLLDIEGNEFDIGSGPHE
ncbi:MAG: VOC family protein [Angustibacter sp.]